MSRPLRYSPGGMVFHVLNRGVGRRTLFDKDQDFLAFERVIEETLRTCPMRICAYCLLSNHWHMVVWPEHDGDLPGFMQQMTNTHVKRWKEHRHETGLGHLCQGRYKCFPVETDEYFYQAVRYVERNAMRASLVERAECWPWCSLRRGERDDLASPILFGMAVAEASRVAPDRQPTADRGGTGGDATVCETRLSVGRCGLDCANGEATGTGIDPSPPWEAEERAASVTNRVPILSKFTKFGGWHLFLFEPVSKQLQDLFTRGPAVEFLKAMGPAAEPAVIKQLGNLEPSVRREAALILKEIGTAKSIPALEKATEDPNVFAKSAAEEALAAVKKRQR